MIKKTLEKIQKKGVTPFLDLILGKTMSKKLMVFLIATAFVLTQYLTGQEWIEVAKWYFGAQGAVDLAQVVKGSYEDKSNIKIKPGNEDNC